MYTQNQIQECQGKSDIQQEDFFASKSHLKVRNKIIKCYTRIWSIRLYGAENIILRKIGQK